MPSTADSKFVESSPSGQAYACRIHAKGCSDLPKEKRRGFEQYPAEAENWTDWTQAVFGDIASDEYEVGTDEWKQACLFEAGEVRVMPCAKAAGFGGPK
ncbi:hypothetical protein SEA_EPSOCAMISIO_86 [Gordonia phage Epsocamisio]|nr:hypothetical protein SEA_EPSOCAMISIO_86 [Gordonia phage Epsocamisio]